MTSVGKKIKPSHLDSSEEWHRPYKASENDTALRKRGTLLRKMWNLWKGGKTANYGTLQEPLFMSRERNARPSKEALSAHSHVYAASSEVALGQDMALGGNIPKRQTYRCWLSHENYGVLAIVV